MRGRALLLLLAACGGEEPERRPPPPVDPQPYALTGRWGAVTVHDLVLEIPEDYGEQMEFGNQRIYLGPEVLGFRSSVQVFERPWKEGAEAWFRHQRDLHDAPARGETLLEEGRAQVAGLPARRLVWETVHGTGREPRRFVTIAWCWVRGERAYWLRGLADQRTFALGHRRVFERVASSVRFR